MEEKLNQTPCAVQKIETSQGVSVSYKEHLLYSKYNPSKNIITLVENLELLPGSIILCCSPLLGYGLPELCKKLQENCLIVLCEAEQALYDFTVSENTLLLAGEIIINCPPASLESLPLKLYDIANTGLYKRVIRLDMSAGVQFHKDFYDKLYTACSDSVMTFWKNRLTLTKFGRRYSKNLFENLHYLAETKPISDFFNTVEKPLIVFGAGESTQKFINGLLRRCAPRNDETLPFYILCADTALQPLLKNGIRPDGVFVEEAQSVIVRAFTGTPKDIHIFAGLSSIPNLVHRAGPENLSYFFTDYTKAAFIDNLKAQSFMPPSNQPFGSVGLTAVYYALKFRKNENVPVYIAGLDFSYSTGLTHTKGALAHILRLIHANRLLPAGNYAAAYGTGTEKIPGKNGQPLITSPTLKSYAAMFRNFFGAEKNLFDAGESGIDLGLPRANIDMDCHVANAPRNDEKSVDVTRHCTADATRHCEAAVRSNPHVKEINEYLSNERKALEELLDLLTGHTKLKDEELMQKIESIAKPREYLYLHFPDGYKFSTSQSFLNRIRTEIDFFLKYL